MTSFREAAQIAGINDLSSIRDVATMFMVEPPISLKRLTRKLASMSPDVTIDVLVLYTPEATARLGRNPTSTIQKVIDLQNSIFLDSGVVGRVNLCGAEILSEFSEVAELPYREPNPREGAETGKILDIIKKSLADDDKFGIRMRRERFNADIVSIWVELEGENTKGSNSDGLGESIFAKGSVFAAERAFLNVIITAKASSSAFHFAHELGHNLGLGHDVKASVPTLDLIFPYAHGYVDNDNTFRTVMALKDSCSGCSRIPFYSSADPTILFKGKPIGKVNDAENDAENARVLKDTIPFVASYRTKPIP
jgi:Metallo-peptidase family M12